VTSSNQQTAIDEQAETPLAAPVRKVTYGGEKIDKVALQNLQLMICRRFNATAGQLMQLFACGKAIQAVAGEGSVTVQSQADSLNASA
jgi:type VI secretion system secreted protein VgrG